MKCVSLEKVDFVERLKFGLCWKPQHVYIYMSYVCVVLIVMYAS
jgi:hypothetical protein